MSDTQLIFGPAFILMGFVAIGLHIYKSRMIKASLNWPVANGIIMHAYYFRSTSRNSSPSGPDVRYYFVANGRKYESSRVSIIDEYSAKEILGRFKEGDKVDVYYNPDNPKMSVLIPGGNMNIFVNLFLVLPVKNIAW